MKKKIPSSSYRLQLSKDFDFLQAKNILPYLKELGISMVYTSPFFSVVKGLNNPYMITSPHAIAKELGGEGGFVAFCSECKRLGLMHMMDIVPNHMAASKENAFFWDVVEKKRESKYADYFDIDWEFGKGDVVSTSENNIHAEINYRRFFDICEMICLNMEHDEVYQWYFSTIRTFVEKGMVQGFRVDHIDGLKYPRQFLEKLTDDFPGLYVVLEKIVQKDEMIRENFICDGSVGYEMLFLIDQLFVNKDAKKDFDHIYQKYREEDPDLAKIRIDYLNRYLISEVTRFSSYFGVEKEQLLQFLAHFPVYRTYVENDAVDPLDKEAIEYAASFTTGTFFKEDIIKKHREDLIKLQQILPAVFAKSYEDTYLYRNVMLCSLNEVGGDLGTFSISNEYFIQSMKRIYKRFPNTMHTLSTHDTKRSLDARNRINVLSEMDFSSYVEKWMNLVPSFESTRIMYLFFQTLIAISDHDEKKRVIAYMIKACREGKYYSDHLAPNLDFEKSLTTWIKQVLVCKEFMDAFIPVKEKVVLAAKKKSLCALVLQMGLFGVMDVYQGEELDNANLVDPDNRREVDFPLREKRLKDRSCLKMNVLHTGLLMRKENMDILQKGTFEQVKTRSDQIGYRRRLGNKEIVVIVNKSHYGKNYGKEVAYKQIPSIFGNNQPFGIFIDE